jgi:hypothetical protein
MLSWGVASMEETESRRNNLSMLFLYLDAAPTGGIGRQVAWSSCWSPDRVRFLSGGRRLALSRVTVSLAAADVCDVLQLGARMTIAGGVPLLRICRAKLTTLGFGDHEEDPRPTRHKISGSSLVTARFIGSNSIIGCDGALPDLGLAVVCLFFRRWQRTMDDVSARHEFLQGWNYNFTSCRVYRAKLLDMHVFSCDDHICDLEIYGYLKKLHKALRSFHSS